MIHLNLDFIFIVVDDSKWGFVRTGLSGLRSGRRPVVQGYLLVWRMLYIFNKQELLVAS